MKKSKFALNIDFGEIDVPMPEPFWTNPELVVGEIYWLLMRVRRHLMTWKGWEETDPDYETAMARWDGMAFVTMVDIGRQYKREDIRAWMPLERKIPRLARQPMSDSQAKQIWREAFHIRYKKNDSNRHTDQGEPGNH